MLRAGHACPGAPHCRVAVSTCVLFSMSGLADRVFARVLCGPCARLGTQHRTLHCLLVCCFERSRGGGGVVWGQPVPLSRNRRHQVCVLCVCVRVRFRLWVCTSRPAAAMSRVRLPMRATFAARRAVELPSGGDVATFCFRISPCVCLPRGMGAVHGTAHFLTHMAFKRTHKRTSGKIFRDIEAFGGAFSAGYTRDLVSEAHFLVEVLGMSWASVVTVGDTVRLRHLRVVPRVASPTECRSRTRARRCEATSRTSSITWRRPSWSPCCGTGR